jgi:hypothetical protein
MFLSERVKGGEQIENRLVINRVIFSPILFIFSDFWRQFAWLEPYSAWHLTLSQQFLKGLV